MRHRPTGQKPRDRNQSRVEDRNEEYEDRRDNDPFGGRATPADMLRSLGAPGSNYFVFKMSYWIPVG